MSSTDDLPRALPAMWRALKRGYEAAPLLLSVAFGLALLAALPDALLAVWFRLLADGMLGGRRGLVLTAAVGLGVSAAATWFLRITSERTQRRFRDQVTIALESHVAWLQASVATIEHHERPVYLDRLAMLRNQIFVLDHMYMSLFTTCGWILRLGVTIALLVSIHPALALLAAFALPTVLTSTWRPGVERATEERGTSANRLARHLFDVATTAPAGKEVRVTRIGARLVAERRAAWERWYGPVARARGRSAVWHALAWALFGAAYVGAVVFVASVLAASPGDVLLCPSPTPAPNGSCSTTWTCVWRRARWSPSWERMARARRRSSSSCVDCINRHVGASSSTTWSSRACPWTPGGPGFRGRFRTSSGSSSGCARRWVWAICPASTTGRP